MALGIGSTWTRACGRWRRAWAGDGAAKADTGWPCVLIERGLDGEPVDVDAIIRQWSAHPFMDFFVAVELLRLQCREAPPRRGPPPV